MKLRRFLARPAMVAAMASALATVAVCYVAYARVIQHHANLWEPLTWQVKAALVVAFCTPFASYCGWLVKEDQ